MHDISALGNRLRKTYKTRRSWAARLGIEAYRLYDEDIPEHKYVVDVYKDHAVVFDLSDPRAPTPDAVAAEVQAEVESALGLPGTHVHYKLRRRMPGVLQYEKLGATGALMPVREETSTYLVNLTDYLDTGLFLDHRPIRSRFRKLPPGLRLLNLFSYTGSVSVAAAQSGAQTTSVDMSNTYMDWTKANFDANGLKTADHAFVREDALKYLKAGPGDGPLFDVVFLDPPTFSNSKRMDAAFDVQRDHAALIEQTMAFVAPGGTLYFSTNRRRFVLEGSVSAAYQVEDESEVTIPEDFRDRKIHRCFRIQGAF